METILVTGGAGFIGSNFVRCVLSGSERQVVVLDKLTYAGSLHSLAPVKGHSGFAFVHGDIADRACVDRVLQEHRPAAIVNFAAETHVDRSIDEPGGFVQTNIVGAFQLLEAGRTYLESLSEGERGRFRMLHVSTDEVYGSLGDDGLFSESTPYAPNSPYAASKASADHLVRAYHHTFGFPGLITNCSNNYGPYQFPEKLIPLMTLNAIEAKSLPIYGDGKNVRDWLHVDDHCSGILQVLEKGRPGESYNIGGGNEKTNLEILDTICSTLERLYPAASNPAMQQRGLSRYEELKTFVTDRKGHDRRYAIDASKIRAELDWKPTHGFDKGMEMTVRWYLDNREWCETVQNEGRYGRERLGL